MVLLKYVKILGELSTSQKMVKDFGKDMRDCISSKVDSRRSSK